MPKSIAEFLTRITPSKKAAMRASISLIPSIGGAFDHLLFDRADEIRISNIEKTIEILSESYNVLEQKKIDMKWFESAEAISIFKELIELIEYETDQNKIKTTAQTFVVFSKDPFSAEPNKKMVLRKISELTEIQKKIFIQMAQMKPSVKNFSSGGLKSEETAIWIQDIANNIATLHYIGKRFWNDTLDINFELEILVATGLIRSHKSQISNQLGFMVTGLGNIVATHLLELS